MIHRIHQKLGTAGFLIAIVALVAALGGTALAAKGALTGKQKKEVTKIAKQYAGKPGAAGAAGPTGAAGPKGDTGAQGPVGKEGPQGKEGIQGKQGIQGIQGVPGTTGFTDTLPSGKTETGVWTAAIPPTSEFFEYRVPISFPIPLEEGAEKAFFFTPEQVQLEEFGTSGCKWELENLDALPESTVPGTLCMFAAHEEEAEFNTFHSPGSQFDFGYGPSGSSPGFIHPSASSATQSTADGVWAITAP
jgi:hypothetical protein